MKASLPTITDHLKGINLGIFKFFRPSTTSGGLQPVHQKDSATSPASEILSGTTMTLPPETIVPFHVHNGKEKWYRFLSGSSVEVLMWRNERMEKYILTRGSQLVIPKNIPHAVIHSCIDPCSILVISSSRDAEDIEWEPATEQLLENIREKAA